MSIGTSPLRETMQASGSAATPPSSGPLTWGPAATGGMPRHDRLVCGPMQFRQLDRGELIAVLGGILLGVSLFMVWYKLGDKYSTLNGCKGPHRSCTGWAS